MAGLPAAITFAGISFSTTDPAAMIELSPMVTPFNIVLPQPIHTLLPITFGFLFTKE